MLFPLVILGDNVYATYSKGATASKRAKSFVSSFLRHLWFGLQQREGPFINYVTDLTSLKKIYPSDLVRERLKPPNFYLVFQVGRYDLSSIPPPPFFKKTKKFNQIQTTTIKQVT